ncbi:ATP-binding cassette domain-containing protein [Arthrobacter sp. OVS8]|nr:ATP-binding cassette domain-containing protein [Arthrobacter sp. OVS8]
MDDVSFHVDRGEILGIVGESGSGKSQTAFSILGLLPDNARIVAGSIQFDGNYTVAPGRNASARSGCPSCAARGSPTFRRNP